MIRRTLIILALSLMTAIATAEDPRPPTTPTISVTSKGQDVKLVIAEAFAQADRPYVIEPNVRATVFLAFTNQPLDRAIALIARAAGLQVRTEEGVTFFSSRPATPPPVLAMPNDPAPVDVKPSGMLPTAVLARRLTTKLAKRDIRLVLAEFGKQTGVTIEVDKSVPAYRVDAFLRGTSLKFALDQVTEAAGLEYRMTNQRSILVTRASDSRISQAGS